MIKCVFVFLLILFTAAAFSQTEVEQLKAKLQSLETQIANLQQQNSNTGNQGAQNQIEALRLQASQIRAALSRLENQMNIAPGIHAGKFCDMDMDYVTGAWKNDTVFSSGFISRFKIGEKKDLENQQEKWFKITNASALVLALLKQLGNEIIVLTCMKGSSEDLVNIRGEDLSYFKRRMLSSKDYLEIIQESRVNREEGFKWRIRFYFPANDFVEYEGREIMGADARDVQGYNHPLSLKFQEGKGSVVNVKREIKGVYLLADSDQTPEDIIKKLEKKMDEFRLDLYYKIPGLIPLQKGKL
jgi:hypothetical protein